MLAHIASRDLTATRGHACRCASPNEARLDTTSFAVVHYFIIEYAAGKHDAFASKRVILYVMFHQSLKRNSFLQYLWKGSGKSGQNKSSSLVFLALRTEPWRTRSDLNKQIPKVESCFSDIQFLILLGVNIVIVTNTINRIVIFEIWFIYKHCI